MYIILAIIAFGVLIAVHELGHFVTAKAFGVKVNEFSLGMGPLLWKKQGKETLYSLRALPIGGFCAMEGEDEETGDPRAFSAKKPWQKAIVLVAGAAMNFVLGFLLICCIAPNANFTEPVIAEFMEGCPYEGVLQRGDRIYSVNGHRTFFTNNVAEYMARTQDDMQNLVVIRDGHRVALKNQYMPKVEYTTEAGESILRYGFYYAPRSFDLGSNIKYSWYESLDFVRLVWRSLAELVTGNVGMKDLSGPVGIVDLVNDAEQSAQSRGERVFRFFYIFALIAVNLAVMNLLPIPALDGGRVFFLLVTWLVESVIHRKIDPKYEAFIHNAGFVLLMGLMVIVMFNDVIKLFLGQ